MGGNLKTRVVLVKGGLVLGILYGLSTFLTVVLNEMSSFSMEYGLGFTLINVAPVAAYFLVGLVMTLGHRLSVPFQLWIGLGVLVGLMACGAVITYDPVVFVKYNRMIQEVWRIGGLVLGLLVGLFLTKRYLKA
jgi:hypothetical protein